MEGRGRRACDLLVRNGHLVTMNADRRVFASGAIAVADGAIAAIGEEREVLSRFEGRRTLDARGGVVHPGFVECHTHVSLHITRGAMPETMGWEDAVGFYTDFWNVVDAEDEHVASLLACVEMVRNGTTCFLEAGTVLEPAAAAEAAERIGIRALLADPFLWDVGGFSADAPVVERAPARAERAFDVLGGELRRNADPHALVRGHVALVGMGSASDELALAAKAMADESGVVLNQHQSYGPLDTADDDRRHGRHPLVHYADIGLLDRNSTFAHVNVVRDDEVDPVVASGMSIAWCPAASMMFGIGGTARGRHLELHRSGVNVALGSDSVNWAGRFDLGTQALLALLTAREKTGERDALVAEEVLAMATVNGARACGLADRVGTLEVGRRADLVVRRVDVPEAVPALNPVGNIVYASRSKSVDTVLVDGEVVVEGGQVTKVDEGEVYARADAAARRVLARMGRSVPDGHREVA
jgi:5-methylthioadenosine/S-adenosylhomocysteine deaminase